MLIKEAKWKKCKECGKNLELIRDKICGCDNCKKEMNFNNKGVDFLEISVYFNNNDPIHYYCCSWQCVFEKLKTIESDYFITLPYLQFDTKAKGCRVKDFWKAIKNLKEE